jgi:hypothetical protein
MSRGLKPAILFVPFDVRAEAPTYLRGNDNGNSNSRLPFGNDKKEECQAKNQKVWAAR